MINDNQIIAADSVWTQVGKGLIKYISPSLTYTDSYWKQTRFKKEKVEYTETMVQYFKKSKEFWIYTGHVPRVIQTLQKEKIPFTFETKIRPVEFDSPHIQGITFREDQEQILEVAISQGRGLILSPTGSGKSILIRGLISAFNQEKVLFLVHTTDLVQQMMDDLKGEVDSLGEWSGKTKNKARVMVATIQSFHKVVSEWVHYFDVILIDEAHHCHSIKNTYGKTLTLLSAPSKFGFTATYPTTDKGRMHLEALIGPVIANFTIQDATKIDILAKPIIEIIKVPDVPGFELFDESTVPIPQNRIKDPDYRPTKYTTVYWNGLVTNTTRNMMIINLADNLKRKQKTTLVSVVNLEHGEELCDIAIDYFDWKYGKDFVFINGSTPKKERNQIKKDFEAKKYKMVIATTVWSEGISIKSIDCCIIASAGKSKIGVIQKIGRGLRKTTKKNKVIIYDFQDTCHKYLRNHFKARYKVYQQMGWLE